MNKLNIRLSENEQKVINTVYEHFCETGEWIKQFALHTIIDKKIVEKVISRKKPQLMREYGAGNANPCYALTFLGIYVCPIAKDDIELLYKYLDLLKQKFTEKPEIREVFSSEVENSLNITKEQSRRLEYLISDGYVWSGQSEGLKEEWKFWMPRDIEDLVDIEDPKEYLEKRIRKQEKARRCERLKMLGKHRIYPWVLLIVVSLMFLLIISLGEFLGVLVYLYVTVSIWIILYSFSKIMELFEVVVPIFSSGKVLDKIIWFAISSVISVVVGKFK